LSESSSSDESIANDVEEIDERHEVQLLTSPSKHHVEVIAMPVPKIKIEDLEDDDIGTVENDVKGEHSDTETEPEDVADDQNDAQHVNVEKVVRFDDESDAESNVLKKTLSTVDIANEIMKEIGSKVNFSEDGSILTNDSDSASSEDEADRVGEDDSDDTSVQKAGTDDVTRIQADDSEDNSRADDVTRIQGGDSDDDSSQSDSSTEVEDNADDVIVAAEHATTVLGQVEVHQPVPEINSDSESDSDVEISKKKMEMSDSDSDTDAKSVDSGDSKYIDTTDGQATNGRFRIESLGH